MKPDYEKAAEALEKKLAKYLKEEGLTSLNASISEMHLKRLFFTFTKDFLNYKIFFDDYSTLCEKLLGVLLEKKAAGHDTDLFSICNYGAELSWYIRNEPFRAADFLETILSYYREHSPESQTQYKVCDYGKVVERPTN